MLEKLQKVRYALSEGRDIAVDRKQTVSREGYLNENYHYFHLRDTAGQERDFHFHEFDKLVLLLSGRVDYTVESVTYTLRPWDVLLVRHHAIHRAVIDKSEPYDRVIVYLDRRFFERSLPGAGLMVFSVLFAQLGIPGEAVLLGVTINIIFDFAATGFNVGILILELTREADRMHRIDRTLLLKKM